MMIKDLKDALTRPKLRLTQADLCLTQAQTRLTQAKFCPNSAKKSPNSNFRRVVVSARQKSAEKNPLHIPRVQPFLAKMAQKIKDSLFFLSHFFFSILHGTHQSCNRKSQTN